MELKDIKNALQTEPYDFLRSDPRLRDRVILLALGGSYAYGTNHSGSDIDLRGCALQRPQDLLGFAKFESCVDTATDTTIYSFNRFVELLLDCNPNALEMIGCRPEHYIVLTEAGRRLLDNAHLFLSQKAAVSFSEYAHQQLQRLESAIARDRLPQSKREEYILGAMQRASRTFADRYTSFDMGSMRLYTAESQDPDLEKEIYIDVHMDKLPARQFRGVINDLDAVLSNYNKLNKRNKKKDIAHLRKHAMHLVRIRLTGIELLETGKMVTYREKDLPLLLSIKEGAYQNEDGTIRDDFYDLLSELSKRELYARSHTVLPEQPDIQAAEEFVMEMNYQSLH